MHIYIFTYIHIQTYTYVKWCLNTHTQFFINTQGVYTCSPTYQYIEYMTSAEYHFEVIHRLRAEEFFTKFALERHGPNLF